MKYFLFLAIFITALKVLGQNNYYDVAPKGQENVLPYEGGQYHMKIDSLTSLNTLIEKLNDNWHLLETGKGYWIGYTNNMFSIASRKQAAILPLIKFIESKSSEKGKKGAIFTLHLIGIDSKIVGRFYEQFVDTPARKALLYLLKYENLQPLIMSLLKRNPWRNDLPSLFKIMGDSKNDTWAIVNSLSRYKLKGFPLQQRIPIEIGQIEVDIQVSKKSDLNNQIELNIYTILDSIKKLNDKRIIVEDVLLKSRIDNNYCTIYADLYSSNKFFISEFLNIYCHANYIDLGLKLQYYFENDKLTICSINTAKYKVLSWWNTLSKEDRDFLINERLISHDL